MWLVVKPFGFTMCLQNRELSLKKNLRYNAYDSSLSLYTVKKKKKKVLNVKTLNKGKLKNAFMYNAVNTKFKKKKIYIYYRKFLFFLIKEGKKLGTWHPEKILYRKNALFFFFLFKEKDFPRTQNDLNSLFPQGNHNTMKWMYNIYIMTDLILE